MDQRTSTLTVPEFRADNGSAYHPYPFQRRDAEWLAQFKSSSNFSEMGTGKTYTAIELLRELQLERVLIVTTKTGKIPWSLMAPSAIGLPVLLYPPISPSSTGPPGLYLAHYQQFQNNSKVLDDYMSAEWDMVILDEAHRIKNPKAQWTKNLCKLNTTYRHLMTGTPFANNPSEAWSLLNFLKHDAAKGGFWRFRGHFCDVEVSYLGYSTIKGPKERNLPEFREVLSSQGVRHTKLELFPDLPEIIPDRIPVQLNATQRRMYDEIKRELSTLDANGVSIDSPTVISQMSRLRQISDGTPRVISKEYDGRQGRVVTAIELTNPSAKLDALIDKVESTNTQVVVFSNFHKMLALLEERLQKAKISHIWMRQPDNERQREDKITAFQNGAAQVFFNTIKLGSEAITLTAADTVIFLDLDWNPHNNDQAFSRVHRKGQKRPTHRIEIYSEDTIDGYVKGVGNRKYGWFETVFG